MHLAPLQVPSPRLGETGVSPGPADPLVVQVSRWDQLKDMSGVMADFAGYVAPTGGGYLVLAGSAVTGVADDPEGAAVFADCLLQWCELPAAARARILLVTRHTGAPVNLGGRPLAGQGAWVAASLPMPGESCWPRSSKPAATAACP
ncbi:MAG TPA: hypothetical protein VIX86_02210 [Streptosporangiaceae bacterium]